MIATTPLNALVDLMPAYVAELPSDPFTATSFAYVLTGEGYVL